MPSPFTWVCDWFDEVADGNDALALVVVEEDGSSGPSPALLHVRHHRRPKLVEHTQVSYPVGHLSTMFWLGVRPGDGHLNISSAGWAKHAWSCFFAPWIAEATIVVLSYARFDPQTLLRQRREQEVTTFCAPPTGGCSSSPTCAVAPGRCAS